MQINSYMPVRVVSGKNCVIKNKELILSFGKKCLILTGKNSARLSGALDDVTGILESGFVQYSVFDEIEPNPLTETCRKAGEVAREAGAEYIIGIGGGSVLDAAKAVAVFCSNPDFLHSDIYNRSIPATHIPVILIGTTAGTGSEVTGVSVLTNSDTGLKKSISGPDCYADIAFCDYGYTESVNTETRISTCLDALAHAIESYLSSTANDLSSLYAVKAIKLISPYIINGDFHNLADYDFERLYISSIYAGLAINITGTCFPHTVGYFLTESFNISHGLACAAFMPNLLDRAKKYCPEKLEAILEMFSCSYEKLVSIIKGYNTIDVHYSDDAIEEVCLRWKSGVRNFDRSPGGFDYLAAQKALKAVIS